MTKSITLYAVALTEENLAEAMTFDNEFDAKEYNYNEFNGYGTYFTLEVPLDWTKAVETTNPYHEGPRQF